MLKMKKVMKDINVKLKIKLISKNKKLKNIM